MISPVTKEKMLYETTIDTNSSQSFLVAFADYFSFISTDGIELLSHLSEPTKQRLDEHKIFERDFENIRLAVAEDLARLTKLAVKLNLQNDNLFADRLSCLKTFVDGNYVPSNDDPFSSYDLDMLDAVRELYNRGYKKEAGLFLSTQPTSVDSIRLEHLSAFSQKKEYLTARKDYIKRGDFSIEGAFMRLVGLYIALTKIEGGNNVDPDDFVLALSDPKSVSNYLQTTKAGARNSIPNLDLQKCRQDTQRLHNSIIMNNPDEAKQSKGYIFYTKDGDIYHYDKPQKLMYRMRGNSDPVFIQLLRNVIDYMPPNVERMKISEFKKLLPLDKKKADDYRANLSKSAKPFNNFLLKNGVLNVRPDTKEPVLEVTDAYITLRNNL